MLYNSIFTNFVIAEFSTDFLSFPDETEVDVLAIGFKNLCQMRKIIGAINCTHIAILPPKNGCRDFINRKGWPSYNVLAIVDNFYR